MNKIGLKSIEDLLKMDFYIPNYQRGYRWTEQQVKDLLNDIKEFIENGAKGIYCIQPLVVICHNNEASIEKIKSAETLEDVKNLLKDRWEVIDGQQRLTTIYILLKQLGESTLFSIEYETRKESRDFLKKLDPSQKENNIDYSHFIQTDKAIKMWLQKNKGINETFKTILLNQVKFIWYISTEKDPISIFTRLNVGKIALTNAELIKALFLNKRNFEGQNYHQLSLHQKEIAIEWDNIEYSLQNDEFWLFLHEIEYNKPTRIDFIFDIIHEKGLLFSQQLTPEQKDLIGNDDYSTFRYFYIYFNAENQTNNPDITFAWNKVKEIFNIFKEWFNNLELYHYIGYLVATKDLSLSTILDNWIKSQGKECLSKDRGGNITGIYPTFFNDYIIAEIKESIQKYLDLDTKYEEGGFPKSDCRPLLLLHNIQTVINQNKNLKENDRYKLPVFYKFPFHLYKKEGWDIEHIDSHTENPLNNNIDQKEWLKNASLGLPEKDKLKEEIKNFIKDRSNKPFEKIYLEIYKKEDSKNKLNQIDKDKIWNFALLDYGTNRTYKNSIFAAKRRYIIGKDQGIVYHLDEELNITPKKGIIAFIPPCTKSVFLKYYNASTNNLREWSYEDAISYLRNIRETLEPFGVYSKVLDKIDNSNNNTEAIGEDNNDH